MDSTVDVQLDGYQAPATETRPSGDRFGEATGRMLFARDPDALDGARSHV